ncbi:Protein white [Stylophora pistillata]|uniref:Protein white n=1 Tax=Stylophora pistillata TaxID=50429 RepID=A0A2B4S0C3_STYPI|nr:Protein white [Stylophora pistillata]
MITLLKSWLNTGSSQHSPSHLPVRNMGDNGRSRSLLHGRKGSKSRGYSTFDPGGSIDSGVLTTEELDRNSKGRKPKTSAIEDGRESVSVSWENIDVFVELPGPSFLKRLCFRTGDNERPATKQVLFNVSGMVEAGTLLAVMGSSGAGKSTLMNVLAHRNISQVEVRGTVKVNDRPIGAEINSMSAYIQQEDIFIGSLTVREHLTFQAFLRMGKNVPKRQRIERVEEVILQLGLTKCADTYIGIPGRLRGISGGEKKRLSFASEVITDPPLLFADEPTSGLDSFLAQSLVTALQQLAAQGRTIICTIHQPSSDVYAMFDSLGYPCPVNFNPADHFIHTLAIVPGDEENCHTRVKTFPEELSVFLREHHNGMYRSDVYFLSKTTAEVPLFLVNPLFLISIAYWMIGLRQQILRFLYAYGIFALISMVAVSYGYTVSTLSPTVAVASAISAPLLLPLLLLGGFYVKNTTIPVWLSWLQYVSWFNYGFEAMLVNQWDGYGGKICSGKNKTDCISGDQVLNDLGVNKDNGLIDIYALLALTIGFRFIAYLFLLKKAYKKP